MAGMYQGSISLYKHNFAVLIARTLQQTRILQNYPQFFTLKVSETTTNVLQCFKLGIVAILVNVKCEVKMLAVVMPLLCCNFLESKQKKTTMSLIIRSRRLKRMNGLMNTRMHACMHA